MGQVAGGLVPRRFLLGRRPSRHKDDRRRGRQPHNLRGALPARHDRHVEVEQDEGVGLRRQTGERFLSVARRRDLVAVALKGSA